MWLITECLLWLCFEDVVETCSVMCFLFQAVLWGWLALGWMYDHRAFGTAAALWRVGFLLPPVESPKARWQRWGYQECGELKNIFIYLSSRQQLWAVFPQMQRRCGNPFLEWIAENEDTRIFRNKRLRLLGLEDWSSRILMSQMFKIFLMPSILYMFIPKMTRRL